MDSPWCPLSHGTKRWEEQLGQGHAGGHHGQPHGVLGTKGWDGLFGKGHTKGHHGQPHGVPCPREQRDGMDSLDKAIPGDIMDSPWCSLSHETKGRGYRQLGHGHTRGHHGQPMVSPVPWDKGMGRTAWTRSCWGTPWTAPWRPRSHGTKGWDGRFGQGHTKGHHGQPHGVPDPMGQRDGMDGLDKAILRDIMDSPMVSQVPWNKGMGWTVWTRSCWGTPWTAPWCPRSHETKGQGYRQLGHGHTGGHHGQPMAFPVPWDKGTGI